MTVHHVHPLLLLNVPVICGTVCVKALIIFVCLHVIICCLCVFQCVAPCTSWWLVCRTQRCRTTSTQTSALLWCCSVSSSSCRCPSARRSAFRNTSGAGTVTLSTHHHFSHLWISQDLNVVPSVFSRSLVWHVYWFTLAPPSVLKSSVLQIATRINEKSLFSTKNEPFSFEFSFLCPKMSNLHPRHLITGRSPSDFPRWL